MRRTSTRRVASRQSWRPRLCLPPPTSAVATKNGVATQATKPSGTELHLGADDAARARAAHAVLAEELCRKLLDAGEEMTRPRSNVEACRGHRDLWTFCRELLSAASPIPTARDGGDSVGGGAASAHSTAIISFTVAGVDTAIEDRWRPRSVVGRTCSRGSQLAIPRRSGLAVHPPPDSAAHSRHARHDGYAWRVIPSRSRRRKLHVCERNHYTSGGLRDGCCRRTVFAVKSRRRWTSVYRLLARTPPSTARAAGHAPAAPPRARRSRPAHRPPWQSKS